MDNTLYHYGVDSILRLCLTHDEAKVVLNDFHRGMCGGHLSGLSTAQNFLRAGYFWPSIFKDYVNAIKKCRPRTNGVEFFQMKLPKSALEVLSSNG